MTFSRNPMLIPVIKLDSFPIHHSICFFIIRQEHPGTSKGILRPTMMSGPRKLLNREEEKKEETVAVAAPQGNFRLRPHSVMD